MPLSKPARNYLAIGVALVLILAIVGGLVWAFGRQLALAQQMHAEEGRLEQAVADEQTRNDGLVAQLDYVQSDEYVECWARGDAGMARPGEVAVVPLDAGERLSVATQPEPTTEPESRPFWVEWWELVFGPAEHP